MSTEPAPAPPAPDFQCQYIYNPSTIAHQVALRAWSRVLDSLDERIDELQRQRSAHLVQRKTWLRQAIGKSGAPPDPAPGFRRQYINNPCTIAECGGPCEEGGPQACTCGELWTDTPVSADTTA